jgi:hypothetical protein
MLPCGHIVSGTTGDVPRVPFLACDSSKSQHPVKTADLEIYKCPASSFRHVMLLLSAEPSKPSSERLISSWRLYSD